MNTLHNLDDLLKLASDESLPITKRLDIIDGIGETGEIDAIRPLLQMLEETRDSEIHYQIQCAVYRIQKSNQLLGPEVPLFEEKNTREASNKSVIYESLFNKYHIFSEQCESIIYTSFFLNCLVLTLSFVLKNWVLLIVWLSLSAIGSFFVHATVRSHNLYFKLFYSAGSIIIGPGIIILFALDYAGDNKSEINKLQHINDQPKRP
jgi:hypothetical protein